jgi:uncharacterized membrane protein YjgN (DUF898 family)
MFTIIGADGKEYGPVSADQIRQWLAQNRLNLAMQVRREGETAWQSLGDLAEFAAADPTAASVPPPVAAASTATDPLAPAAAAIAAPTTTVPTPPEPLVFTGQWKEYFKIWIVNVLLTIVTLGIYAAWAKVRKRRYFYANTRLFGHTFEYLGDPVKILKGNLIVAGLFLILVLSQTISPVLYLGFALVFALSVPWFLVRAFAFNARNTAWRGLRFGFSGTYAKAFQVFFLWPLLVPLTLGLILPYVARKQKAFIVDRHAFGTSPFSFAGTAEGFYKIYGIAVLFFLPIIALYFSMIGLVLGATLKSGGQPKGPPAIDPAAMGLIGLLFLAAIPLAIVGTFYFRSRMFNYLWNHTEIAGHRFAATMRARDLFLLHLVNSLVTTFTLGLLHPWAAIRTAKFQIESVLVLPAGGIDTFVAEAQPAVGAVGDAASDFFDFDIGFGL